MSIVRRFKWPQRMAAEALILALFVLLLILLTALLFLLFNQFLKNGPDDVSKTLVTALFSVLGSVGILVVGKLVEKRMAIEAEIRERKKSA